MSSFAVTLRFYRIATDGTQLQRLTNRATYDRDPAWSPDGQFIAFSTREVGMPYAHLAIMRVDGSDLQVVTHGNCSDTQPAWSPDGQTLLVVREECDVAEPHLTVVRMRPDGSEVQLISQGHGDTLSPSWSPDGRRSPGLSSRLSPSRPSC